MAEHAHIMAAPEVVRLAGSSSPTGEAPAFEAVTSSSNGKPPLAIASGPDADLLALVASHGSARAAATQAEVALTEALARFNALTPKRPEATFYRFGDPAEMPKGREKHLNGYRMVYVASDIEELREVPRSMAFMSGSGDSPEGPGMAWRTDPRRVARRAEILDAYDSWQCERKSVAEQVGWKAARAEFTLISDAVERIEVDILSHQPQTIAGLRLKAWWVVEQDRVDQWAEYILHDVIELQGEIVDHVDQARVA